MSIGRLTSPIIAISKASSAATELFTTIDAEVPDTTGFKDPDVSATADINLEEVSFFYPGRPDVQILDRLNLHFEAGKVTAIVGPSGSGKSTIVALLERWYDLSGTPLKTPSDGDIKPSAEDDIQPTGNQSIPEDGSAQVNFDKKEQNLLEKCSGAVKVGGVDLRKVDLKWWRSQIGLVQQEPFLFNDTIYNNVAYGLCGTKWQDATKEEKMELVIDACKEAYANEFITKLPLVSAHDVHLFFHLSKVIQSYLTTLFFITDSLPFHPSRNSDLNITDSFRATTHLWEKAVSKCQVVSVSA
jgi:ATP-binding cassette subfamily B (MDR/TAP) protein 1